MCRIYAIRTPTTGRGPRFARVPGRALQPARHPAMVRARPAVVRAEAVAAIAALRRLSWRSLTTRRVHRATHSFALAVGVEAATNRRDRAVSRRWRNLGVGEDDHAPGVRNVGVGDLAASFAPVHDLRRIVSAARLGTSVSRRDCRSNARCADNGDRPHVAPYGKRMQEVHATSVPRQDLIRAADHAVATAPSPAPAVIPARARCWGEPNTALHRHRLRYCFRFAKARALPSGVLGPVDRPPCHLQRPCASLSARHGLPDLVRALHRRGSLPS